MPRGRGLDPIALMNKRGKKMLNSILTSSVKVVKATRKTYKSSGSKDKRSLSDDAMQARAARIHQSKQNFYKYYRKGDFQTALMHLRAFEYNAHIDDMEMCYLKWQQDERLKIYLSCGIFAFVAFIVYLILK